jgi:hypothetical protein
MNIGPRKHDSGFDEPEWQAQERALREERNGVAAGDDPLVARYRQVARALRQPADSAPPPDFARTVAARVAAAHAPPDMRLELALLRALSGLLGMSAIVAAALYGGQWLHAFAALLPPIVTGTALNWALALGACLALSWGFGRLPRGARRAAGKA